MDSNPQRITFFVTSLCVTVLVGLSAPGPVRAHGAYDSRLYHASAHIVANPNDALAYLSRAMIHAEGGHFEEAEKDIADARRLKPALSRVEFVRGEVMRLAGRHEDAIDAYSIYIAAETNHPSALIKRSLAYTALQDYRFAAADLDHALTLRPRSAPAVYLMRAERHLDLEDPELAIRGLREGVKSIGPVPTLYIEMLDIQRFEGDNEAALLTVKDLLDTAPANPAWISMKGDVLADLGRHEESGAAHRLALELLDRLPQRNRQFPANRALRGALLGKLSDANPK